MDHRDDWLDRILEGDLEESSGSDPETRRSTERIARDARNMNAVLSAMAEQVGARLPTPIHGKAAPTPWRPARKWRTVAPFAAAAAIAALVLVHDGETVEEVATLIPPPESRIPSMVSEMDVEADRPFAVFPTSDPDIAVVWLLNPKESD
ncbi:MAG: hypothetical protein OXG58_01685 [Gemmatimonadetes bacterium]|nr:hypothetical protein [Gemmatimonadota bacterium]